VQLWHLALPLSMKTQWLTRLLSGLMAGVVCAIAIPSVLTTLARAILRPEFMKGFALASVREPIPALITFFLFVFWCAIVARDLIRTAGLAAAAGGMIFISVQGSIWISERFIEFLEYLRLFVISWNQLNPSAFNLTLGWFPDLSRIPEWILTTALCAAMTIHTYPLFRRLPQESAVKLVKPLMPYLAVIIVFVSLMTIRSWNGGSPVVYSLYSETEKAIVELQPVKPFTVEDLAKASTLSDSTRRWLRDANMTATVTDPPDPNGVRKAYSFGNGKVYNLTIRLASGFTCKAKFPFALN
jgi:hypothetical protein